MKIEFPTPDTIFTIPDTGIEYILGSPLSTDSGFGILYEGKDSFDNPVAIKMFKPANRKYEEVKQQWLDETEKLKRVRHPNVIASYESFEAENLFYIVFERANHDIFDLIKNFGPQAESVVREIARQILFGLNYIHSHKIIHKDLTTKNILVFLYQDRVFYKISDFGISEDIFDPNIQYSLNPVAHQHFKPPELVSHGYTNQQSDLYHLGLILLYCLTGNYPYDISLSQAEIDDAIKTGVPRQTAENIGTPFGDFIAVLLRRRAEYRFSSALEAWNSLKNQPISN